MGALEAGKYSRYLDEPSILGRKETTQDGNDILGYIFGNKDVVVMWLNALLKRQVLVQAY